MQDPQPFFRPTPGVAEPVGPGIRRLVCANPSPMTYRGTNTYLVGTRAIAVIDPGPDGPSELQTLLSALEPGQHISHIVVTHAHLDHSPLAARLARATGAPVLAFGDARAGRSDIMRSLVGGGLVGGGEGVDAGFQPTQCVRDGEVIAGDGWSLRVWHTPGHFGNHIALSMNDIVFSGDLVMGWATSLVSPPDGDLTDFMASCARLAAIRWQKMLPGHGAPVEAPQTRIAELLSHRRGRETSILAALGTGPATSEMLVGQIYTDTPANLRGAAQRNVLAHLIDLVQRGLVTPEGTLSAETKFGLVMPIAKNH